jgi:hypothetical protein
MKLCIIVRGEGQVEFPKRRSDVTQDETSTLHTADDVTHISTRNHYKWDLSPLQALRVWSTLMCIPGQASSAGQCRRRHLNCPIQQSPLLSASECWGSSCKHLSATPHVRCIWPQKGIYSGLCAAFNASTVTSSFKDITALIAVIFS